MFTITVNVSLYGTLAKLAGGRHVAQFDLELPAGACKADLLARLGIQEADRGYLFINSVLYDVPGLTVEDHTPLQDGDHIGIFSQTYVWPYQYRDGVRMAASLQEALKKYGPMHHTYTDLQGEKSP